MYSRVKRTRRQVKRDMYGIPLNEEDDQQEESGTASGILRSHIKSYIHKN